MNNIKSFKDFINERRLSNTTLYSAADKFSGHGHHRLAKDALSKAVKDETEYTIDLVTHEYYPLEGDDNFPTNARTFLNDFSGASGKSKKEKGNFGFLDKNKWKKKYKFIEDARLVLVDYTDDIKLFFTDKTEDKIITLSLDFDINKGEEGNILDVQFKLGRSGQAMLAYRKDIPKLIGMIKQAYHNSSFDNTNTIRTRIHKVWDEPFDKDISDKIDYMFTDKNNRRSFYSDMNVNTLKSKEGIEKFDL